MDKNLTNLGNKSLSVFRPSRFNVTGEEVSNNIAIYNTLTQNLAVLTFAEWRNLQAGVFDPDTFRMGFLVSAEIDEIDLAFRVHRRLRSDDKKGLSVTLVPTVGCNFSCGYCYNGLHSESSIVGTPTSVERGLEYTRENLAPGTVLNLTWYGGEPLLHQKRLVEWSKPFIDLAEERNCEFEADILTNGSPLTDRTATILEQARITSMQISIDWPPERSGRQQKGLTNLETVFDVLEKVRFVPEAIGLVLRINTFPGFIKTFPFLIDSIGERVKRPIEVYCHQIYTSNDDALNTTEAGSFRYQSVQDYSRDYLEARRLLRGAGFRQEYFPEKFVEAICIAQSKKDVIISSVGELRKCPREVNGVGAVTTENGTDNSLAAFYKNFRADQDQECRTCRFLPICHGGCVKEVAERGQSKATRCTPWKYILEEELTDYLRNET
jgi:uncharacterized protein